jgi:hypothetical protein
MARPAAIDCFEERRGYLPHRLKYLSRDGAAEFRQRLFKAIVGAGCERRLACRWRLLLIE